jgi:hypothetical protein
MLNLPMKLRYLSWYHNIGGLEQQNIPKQRWEERASAAGKSQIQTAV